MTVHVLFVCLGNICRSPMAEAIFQGLVEEAGLTNQISVDSAGTGAYHVGEKAHRGTRQILRQHDIQYNGRSRQISPSDIGQSHSYLVVMDESNRRDLEGRYGRQPNIVRLLDFASQTTERNVPDPYYSSNFEYVYQLVKDGCLGLLETICQENGL
ncbi:MAG: low molecular weight phosphotyrosine protein phosphatase [Chloroflexi bacterium]|nr:low molecular weight phosphotyrosine protein phosphatase [Chloroflexota bacterium]